MTEEKESNNKEGRKRNNKYHFLLTVITVMRMSTQVVQRREARGVVIRNQTIQSMMIHVYLIQMMRAVVIVVKAIMM